MLGGLIDAICVTPSTRDVADGKSLRLQNSLELISDATRPVASLLHHVVGQPKIRNTFTLQRLGAASIVIMPIARRIEAAKSDFGGPSTPIGQQPAA